MGLEECNQLHVFKWFHDSAIGGHSGSDATLKRIKSLFYWTGMNAKVQNYVRNYSVCQTNIYDLFAKPGLLQPLPIPEGLVGSMMTSPLPLTSHLFQVTVACAPPPNPSHRHHHSPPLLLPFPISFTSLFSVFLSPSPMGFTLRFVGLEHLPGPDVAAVYVSNHQSFLDIYTLMTLGRSFKFISKTSVFLYPIIGWAMFLIGVIPLKRMDTRSQLECLKRCMDLIKGGASVFFFPEGTRSKDGKLGIFKKGAFSVAAKSRVPVVPITLHGTGNIMPAGKEHLVNSGSVKVVIHRPLESKDPVELCNEARKVIARSLDCED
ncbi:hypothetical protein V2J09_011251 [Rumex salicifolius]